jgi:hypothetical protein
VPLTPEKTRFPGPDSYSTNRMWATGGMQEPDSVSKGCGESEREIGCVNHRCSGDEILGGGVCFATYSDTL